MALAFGAAYGTGFRPLRGSSRYASPPAGFNPSRGGGRG